MIWIQAAAFAVKAVVIGRNWLLLFRCMTFFYILSFNSVSKNHLNEALWTPKKTVRKLFSVHEVVKSTAPMRVS